MAALIAMTAHSTRRRRTRLRRASARRRSNARPFASSIGRGAPPARTEGNQRVYTRGDLARLTFIRRGRELGFSLHAIRELLALAGDDGQPCVGTDRIARAHLAEVRGKLLRLKALQAELQRMVDGCEHGMIADCQVIETLPRPE